MVEPLLCLTQVHLMARKTMVNLVDLTACLKTIAMREMPSCKTCKNRHLSKKYLTPMHLMLPISPNLSQTIHLAHPVMMMTSAPQTKRQADIKVPPKSKSRPSLKKTMILRRKSLFHRQSPKHLSRQRKCFSIAMKMMMRH